MKLFDKINKLTMTRCLFYRTTVLHECGRIMCDCKWPVMYYFYKYVIVHDNERSLNIELGTSYSYLDMNEHSGTLVGAGSYLFRVRFKGENILFYPFNNTQFNKKNQYFISQFSSVFFKNLNIPC